MNLNISAIFWNLKTGNMYSRLIPVVFEVLESKFSDSKSHWNQFGIKIPIFQIPVSSKIFIGNRNFLSTDLRETP
jgi:hypothetical protein